MACLCTVENILYCCLSEYKALMTLANAHFTCVIGFVRIIYTGDLTRCIGGRSANLFLNVHGIASLSLKPDLFTCKFCTTKFATKSSLTFWFLIQTLVYNARQVNILIVLLSLWLPSTLGDRGRSLINQQISICSINWSNQFFRA